MQEKLEILEIQFSFFSKKIKDLFITNGNSDESDGS